MTRRSRAQKRALREHYWPYSKHKSSAGRALVPAIRESSALMQRSARDQRKRLLLCAIKAGKPKKQAYARRDANDSKRAQGAAVDAHMASSKFRSKNLKEMGPLNEAQKMFVWDIIQGALNWRLWAFLGLQDIRQRYRRSMFGPLWLALGLGATMLGIGILYSQILKTNLGSFLPFLALSLLIWNFIAGVTIESTMMFQSNAGLLTSIRVPYTSFALRGLIRNLIVAVHCCVPVIIVFVFLKYPLHLTALFALPGLFLLVANMYWVSMFFGMTCLRFRDIAQMVTYAIQLAMFLTPIIWTTNQVRPGSPYVVYNPFYHLINLVRDPIFYNRIPTGSLVFCSVMFIIGTAITSGMFLKYRSRVAFWI